MLTYVIFNRVYIPISTESNIPDFRSTNGLWNEKLKINFTPEQLVSHTFLIKYPEAKPNAAHIALTKAEEMSKLKTVDDLQIKK